MDIKTKLSASFDVKDSETLVKKAVLDYFQTQYGISTDVSNIDVAFKTTMSRDMFDRELGTPTFAGIEVTIMQPAANTDLRRTR